MTIGQMPWKIIRTKYSHYTMRFMTDPSLALWHRIFFHPCSFLISPARNVDFAYHGSHFCTGFPQRFTCFFGNAQSQLFQTKRDLAVARYNVLLGQLKLRQAVGTLTLDDVKALNQQLVK